MQQQLRERNEKCEMAQLTPRSVQKEGRSSTRHGAEAPYSQGRPMEEQAVSLQPMGTTQSRSPCAAMEEPMGQQWMRPKGGTAHGYPAEAAPGQNCSLWTPM